MTQDMTKENKPFVMATLSGVAYKEPEEASEIFKYWRFKEYKFFDRDGAQCYLIWNDDDAAQEAIQTALDGQDNSFTVKLYPVGTSSGDYWSGGIIITGISFTASLNSPVGFSFTFQGTGTLTLNNA